MGSVRVYLKSLQLLYSPLVWRSSQLVLPVQPLCTSHSKPRQTDRRRTSGQTDGQARVKNISSVFMDEEEELERRGTRSSSFPKSVFAAGTAKRTAELMKNKSPLETEDEDEPRQRTVRGVGRMQPPDRPLPVSEWRKLRESLGNPQRFDIQMMYALISSGSELDVAKSLLTFVATDSGTLSYELLLRYLTKCVIGGHDSEVFDIYDIMRGSFPTLETGASTLFIKSFSRTSRWKEAISILNEIKKVYIPSPRNYGDIIAAALRAGESATAWTLYEEMLEKRISPHPETWEALFQGGKRTEGEGGEGLLEGEERERLLGILLHMRNDQIYPQHALATTIKSWFESLPGQNWKGNWTTVTPKGVCRCCGSELESIQLTAEEYQELKDRVMSDIIQGQDVFNKTTPEELERFKMFVKKKPAFDVVIDGLNVANVTKEKFKQSENLLAVVSELERQGLVILVLGRKHMLNPSRSWNRHNMKLIQQKAHCFFTDNISEDDPFLLYATLHSGNHCRFVSRDLMRDHKACLPDSAARRLFFKWQRGHQLVVDGYVAAGRKVRFQSIPNYDTIIQTAKNSWHVPYDDTEDRSTYEVPQRWLCVTNKQ